LNNFGSYIITVLVTAAEDFGVRIMDIAKKIKENEEASLKKNLLSCCSVWLNSSSVELLI